jgi:hypothetical protein
MRQRLDESEARLDWTFSFDASRTDSFTGIQPDQITNLKRNTRPITEPALLKH